LVIQALRNLGKTHVNDALIKRLDSRLSPADRKRLSLDAQYAPDWISDIMRRLGVTA
jgi:hypothetical protein